MKQNLGDLGFIGNFIRTNCWFKMVRHTRRKGPNRAEREARRALAFAVYEPAPFIDLHSALPAKRTPRNPPYQDPRYVPRTSRSADADRPAPVEEGVAEG